MKLPNLFTAVEHRDEITHVNVVRDDVVEQLKAWTIALDEYVDTNDIAKLNQAHDAMRCLQRISMMLTQRTGSLKANHRAEKLAKKVLKFHKLNAKVEEIRRALAEKDAEDERLKIKEQRVLKKAERWERIIETRKRNREQWAKDHPTRKMVIEGRAKLQGAT